MPAMRHLGAIIAVLAGCVACGCGDLQPAQRSDPETELADMRKRLRELEARLGVERTNNEALAGRINELVLRDRELTDRIAKLNLIKEQQERQIETLKSAPAERDAYRKLAQQLTLEVKRLAEKVQELERQAERLTQGAGPLGQAPGNP